MAKKTADVVTSPVLRDTNGTDSLIYRLIWIANAARCVRKTNSIQASLPGDNRALEPPDPIPNSEVKRRIADGSVGLPHVRVGHRQASKKKTPSGQPGGVLFLGCVDSLSLSIGPM